MGGELSQAMTAHFLEAFGLCGATLGMRSLRLSSLLLLFLCGPAVLFLDKVSCAAADPKPDSASSSLVALKKAELADARAQVRRAEEELAEALRQEAEGKGEDFSSSCAVSASTRLARIRATNPGAAAEYLSTQHRLRSPYYLKRARQLYEAGLRQLRREDRSNEDPFIKQYEGYNQVFREGSLSSGKGACLRCRSLSSI